MIVEHIVTSIAWITCSLLLIFLVPFSQIREAHVIFFFKQFITWLFGLIVVEKGWIEYPVRLFNNSSKTSFTFEYFVYPAICVFFNLYYPKASTILIQFLYYCCYCTGITSIELLLEHHTKLIKYNKWTWYWTWITLLITFFLSRQYYIWFFNIH